MTGNAKDLNWTQFVLGLVVLALALGVFEFVEYDAFVSAYMRILGAIAFALGNLVGYVFLAAILLGALKVIRREGKTPPPKFFLLIATLVISVLSVAIRM